VSLKERGRRFRVKRCEDRGRGRSGGSGGRELAAKEIEKL
jgi:hypothetical protein